jgi:uncharacterized protein
MSEPHADIRFEERGDRGRYSIRMPNGEEAELTYVKRGENHILANHTWVPPAYRGRGVAERLVVRLVEDARASDAKISPLCWFVAAEFRRHKDWQDLLKG